ncbi:MAG: type II toxin-antitoxin system VapC family toxin [Pirellulaceae bacterium]
MIAVDASIAVKWYLHEPFSEEAIAVLTMDEKLVAPSLAIYEVAGAFVRARRRGDIDETDLADCISRWNLAIESRVVSLEQELQDVLRASELAVSIGHPLADCVYLAMAERLNAPLVTADAVFCDKLGSQFPFVHFVADLSPIGNAVSEIAHHSKTA